MGALFPAAALAPSILAKFILGVGVFLLIVTVLDIFVGYGLWRHKNWARITAIVLSVLGLLSFPIGTIFGIVVIYLFAFNKDVKNLFKS